MNDKCVFCTKSMTRKWRGRPASYNVRMRAKKFRNLDIDPTESHAHFKCNLRKSPILSGKTQVSGRLYMIVYGLISTFIINTDNNAIYKM